MNIMKKWKWVIITILAGLAVAEYSVNFYRYYPNPNHNNSDKFKDVPIQVMPLDRDEFSFFKN